MRPLLIFDFDGTVCLGEAPVQAYCDEVCARLQPEVAADVRAAYARYLDGGSDDADGYFAIAGALDGRLAPADLTAAYLASRAWLAAHPDSVAVPAGLGEFLAAAREAGARLELLTNSPTEGCRHVLEHHGVFDAFDRVQGDAGKPARWPQLLEESLGDAPASSLLSIGDVWANDVAPVRERGGATAFIDARGLRSGPATFTAPTLPELYPDLLGWVHRATSEFDGTR